MRRRGLRPLGDRRVACRPEGRHDRAPRVGDLVTVGMGHLLPTLRESPSGGPDGKGAVRPGSADRRGACPRRPILAGFGGRGKLALEEAPLGAAA